MENLRTEIGLALYEFNHHKIPEESQKELIIYGVDFDFITKPGSKSVKHKHLNFFEVANLLKFCREMGITIDANDLLENNPRTPEFQDLLALYENLEIVFNSFGKNKYQILTRKLGE